MYSDPAEPGDALPWCLSLHLLAKSHFFPVRREPMPQGEFLVAAAWKGIDLSRMAWRRFTRTALIADLRARRATATQGRIFQTPVWKGGAKTTIGLEKTCRVSLQTPWAVGLSV
jgi:hypothetical protein